MTTFKTLHSTGGGNVQYIFHISGMPWAIAETKALADLVDANTTYRRQIFGTAEDDAANVLADNTTLTPIFVGLQRPGKISWDLQEIKGTISGGSWSVSLADQPYSNAGIGTYCGVTDRDGLPGVHHIAQPLLDSSCAFAELTADLKWDDTDVHADDISGDWEAAIETGNYRLGWIGGEAIIIDGEYNAGNPTLLWRGAFMTRPGNHLVDVDGASPILYDAPPSVAGQMCTLWGVALDGLSTEILSAPVPVRLGRCSPDIKTERGMTTIQINSILDNLNEEVTVDHNNVAWLQKYVFSRGGSGTSYESIITNYQMPHLGILECDKAGTYGTVGMYHFHPIWLCAQDTSVKYDTWQEVRDALLTELACCSATASAANHDQVSGDGTADNDYVALQYKYIWKNGMLRQINYDDGDDVHAYEASLITGPLAWLFNMGAVYTYEHIESAEFDAFGAASSELKYYNDPFFFYSNYLEPAMDILAGGMAGWWEEDDPKTPPPSYHFSSPWMVCSFGGDLAVTPHGMHYSYWGDITCWLLGGTNEAKRDEWRANYYYEWEWDSDDTATWDGDPAKALGGKIETSLKTYADTFYIYVPNPEITMLSAGDVVTFGSADDHHMSRAGTPEPRYAQATIDSYSVSGSIGTIVLSPTMSQVDGHPKCFHYGSGIFHIRALEGTTIGKK